MERLKAIKNQLIAQVQTQMSDLKCVDTHELGEVIDMIKDIAQAMYYCEVYKAMESKDNPGDHGYSEEYYEREYPMEYLHDEREGRSPARRKSYIESKTAHSDTAKIMKDLENYLQDLTTDMMELMNWASDDEKTVIQKKINTLASKLQNI